MANLIIKTAADNATFEAHITTRPGVDLVEIYRDGVWAATGTIDRHHGIDGCSAPIPEAVYTAIEAAYDEAKMAEMFQMIDDDPCFDRFAP